MPCWTVQTSTVALSGLNEDLLRKALESIGFRINNSQYNYNVSTGAKLSGDRFSDSTSVVLEANGTVTVRNDRAGTIVNELKRAYSGEVVKAASARFGWTVTQTESNKFQVKRRF